MNVSCEVFDFELDTETDNYPFDIFFIIKKKQKTPRLYSNFKKHQHQQNIPPTFFVFEINSLTYFTLSPNGFFNQAYNNFIFPWLYLVQNPPPKKTWNVLRVFTIWQQIEKGWERQFWKNWNFEGTISTELISMEYYALSLLINCTCFL